MSTALLYQENRALNEMVLRPPLEGGSSKKR
ncbi:hypothetical protein BVRB_020020, partial [Beta vulgaris subsp. vulgaris]